MQTAIRPAFLGVLALALGACATATPYQPKTDGYGYSEQKIESNRYRVHFAGNESTDQQTVENYVLFRAAELTLKEGYDWFVLSDRTTKAEKRDDGAMVISFGGFGWGRRYGHGFGIAHPVGASDRERYQANVEVLMKKGKKSDDPNAFNAREIRENLEPVVRRPEVEEEDS